MGDWIRIAVWGLVSGLRSRRNLALENLALRQQLMVLQRQKRTVRLKDRDRLFWIGLRRVWPGWRRALVLVQPATVVGWHRRGFRAYWRWKSRPKGGRPRIDPSVRRLIRHMWSSNPTWGAPRIQAELHKLGIDVSDSTVRRYRPPRPRQPSQNWRSFLENHLSAIVAMDFFLVPTATFRVLYVLVIMAHDRRRILHFNVTTSPSAHWTARQVVEAFPYDTRPRFLLHDRDKIFSGEAARRVRSMGIEDVLTAPGSPWQKALVSYCTSWGGSSGILGWRGDAQPLPGVFPGVVGAGRLVEALVFGVVRIGCEKPGGAPDLDRARCDIEGVGHLLEGKQPTLAEPMVA